MKVLCEEDVFQYFVDEYGIGLVDLCNYDVLEELKKMMDIGVCWVIWMVLFDCEDDFYFVVIVYYLSLVVCMYWEKKFNGLIVWYGIMLEMIGDFLEKLGGGLCSLIVIDFVKC